MEKLLDKDQTHRLGSKNDMDEILEHVVFKKEIISSDMVNLKPDCYNLDQDFLSISKRKKVAQ